jgi:hypothetical protein
MDRVAILSPRYSDWQDATRESLETAHRELKGELTLHTYSVTGTYIHHARTKLLDQVHSNFMAQPYEYVLWIDSDIAFTPSDIVAARDFLINKNEDIVSGLYIERKCLAPLGGPWDEETGCLLWFVEDQKVELDNLYSVGWVGMGFLMHTAELMLNYCNKYPFTKWFDYEWLPLSFPVDRKFTVGGEDITFSRKIIDMGYKLWLNTSIHLPHNGVTFDDYVHRVEREREYAQVVLERF